MQNTQEKVRGNGRGGNNQREHGAPVSHSNSTKTRDATGVGFSGDGRNMAKLGKSGSQKLGAIASDIPHAIMVATGERYLDKNGNIRKRYRDTGGTHFDRLYASLAMVTARLCPYRDEEKKPNAHPVQLIETMRA